MGTIQELKLVLQQNGFVEVCRSEEGTIAWFCKTSASMRLCMDILTNSATVFWAPGPSQLSSKTFRTLDSLKDWFALPEERKLQSMERLT